MSDDTTMPDSTDEEYTAMSGRQSVSGFVSEAVTYVEPDATLRHVAEVLRNADVSLAVVADGTTLYGVVSERDIVGAVALGIDLDNTPVTTIEAENLKWATSTSTVDDVAEEMLENYLRHVLVGSDDGGLVGIVSMRDLLTAYLV